MTEPYRSHDWALVPASPASKASKHNISNIQTFYLLLAVRFLYAWNIIRFYRNDRSGEGGGEDVRNLNSDAVRNTVHMKMLCLSTSKRPFKQEGILTKRRSSLGALTLVNSLCQQLT